MVQAALMALVGVLRRECCIVLQQRLRANDAPDGTNAGLPAEFVQISECHLAACKILASLPTGCRGCPTCPRVGAPSRAAPARRHATLASTVQSQRPESRPLNRAARACRRPRHGRRGHQRHRKRLPAEGQPERPQKTRSAGAKHRRRAAPHPATPRAGRRCRTTQDSHKNK